MEDISTVQMDRYNNIIKEIEEGQNKYNDLIVKSRLLTDQIRIMKILTKPEFAREKLFQIRVKLFRNTYEIHDIFSHTISQDELRDLSKKENVIYYYIEIFISQCFHEKLVIQNWILNCSVSNTKQKVNKSVNTKNWACNPIVILIPFEDSIENSIVDVHLISTDEKNFWSALKLASQEIDVSYKFDTEKPNNETIDSLISKLAKLYNSISLDKSNLLNYEFHCKWDKKKFIETILKNSYHKLDLVKSLSKSDESITIRLLINELCFIKFNPLKENLQIKSSPDELYFIKKYFSKFSEDYIPDDFKLVPKVSELKVIRDELESELNRKNVNIHELFNLYDKYLHFVFKYPV